MTDQPQFEDQYWSREAGRETPEPGPDPYRGALNLARERLTRRFSAEQLTKAGPGVTEAATAIAAEAFSLYNDRALQEGSRTVPLDPDRFVRAALADLLGMGPLEPLLADETVEDIAVNGPDEVMVYRDGGWQEAGIRFESPARLLEMLNRGIAGSNRQANMVMPIADAVLPGKERISVVTHPVASPWPSAVIRIRRGRRLSLSDMLRPEASGDPVGAPEPRLPDYEPLLEGGLLSAGAAAYLHAAVLAGLNIVAVGPTGSGKTTLLEALGREIPRGRRILILEDTPEIDLHQGADRPMNVLYLRTRPESLEGVPAITPEQLVKLALRHRPDALTLGEVRGAEVFDLLNALHTGHRNGLTSLHAFGVQELFMRVFLMLAQSDRGRYLDARRAANLVASTLHIALSLEISGRTRRVRTIAEFTGKVTRRGTPEPELAPMFQSSGAGGKLAGPLAASVHAGAFRRAGIPARLIRPK